MLETLAASPFFGLGLTMLCWYAAVRLQKKTGLLACNPVLVSGLAVMAVLAVSGASLEQYNAGGDIIKLLLAPATAVLSLNIYRQRRILQQYFYPVVLGCFAGSFVSLLSVWGLCRALCTDSALCVSLLPKSVTTAIALGISESAGGIPGITAACVVITGVEGAILAPLLSRWLRITDPAADGVGIGACSHAIGTSKALEIGPLQGAMSSISLCVCGVMTSLLAMFFFP